MANSINVSQTRPFRNAPPPVTYVLFICGSRAASGRLQALNSPLFPDSIVIHIPPPYVKRFAR